MEVEPTCKIFKNGDKEWYLNGKLYRKDGPAIELPDGTTAWLINGRYHREDGPAIERSNGSKFWYLNHVEYTLEDWLETRSWSDIEKMEFYLKWK